MKYKQDWHKSKERFMALWQGEIIDRCCAFIHVPKNKDFIPQGFPDTTAERYRYWTDPEWVYKRHIENFENTIFLGEAFPQIFVNLGAACHAGFFNDIKFRFEETVWFHTLEEPTYDLFFQENSFLYQKNIEMARYMVDRSEGDYFVSMPDTSGNLDALAHLVGSEKLLMDMLEEPAKVHAALNEIQKAWVKINEEIFCITEKNNQGGTTIGWLNTWAEGRHTQMQCDASVMISPKLFKNFVVPELTAQSGWMDISLYHFDGEEQQMHLDMLLSIENLHMIQWTNVYGQPDPGAYIESFKRIQKAGKCLFIGIRPDELDFIMTNLSSKGLFLAISADSKDEGKQILRRVEQLTQE